MKRFYIDAVLIMSGWSVVAQETLATVTTRGNVANASIQIGSGYVNANTTKLFILNPYGKKFALSSGANMINENGFHIYNWTDNPTMPLFSLTNEGNLGIGTHSTTSKLAVNGNIRAKEIKVETSNWPDYVFAEDYKLPSLKETEQHIKEQGHLPGIPSAAEVNEHGINLGDMNAKLLKKIEELTLLLIQQNKRIETLETEHRSKK